MIKETCNLSCSGSVDSWFFSKDGKCIDRTARKNIVTYAAADTIAKMAAGIGSGPEAIGLIYGATASPSIPHPSTTREHTWENVGEEVEDISGNVAILPLSLVPSVSVDGSDYSSNVATFSANTATISDYVFSGGTYADEISTIDPVYFYQVLLLSGVPGAYTIFARASLLSGGVYKSKPDDYELALQWSVKFI